MEIYYFCVIAVGITVSYFEESLLCASTRHSLQDSFYKIIEIDRFKFLNENLYILEDYERIFLLSWDRKVKD